MRVVLLQTPPSRPDMPALGLPYIQAALKAAGHEVRLRDVSLFLCEQGTEEEQAYFDPDHHNLWYQPFEGPAADR